MIFSAWPAFISALLGVAATACAEDAIASRAKAQFDRQIEPLLKEYCFGCHAEGANEGGMSFETWMDSEDDHTRNQMWFKVLKQLRANLMPPPGESQLTGAQTGALEDWIKYGALGLSNERPDPGRVTLRRLNRTEYKNTIRDLVGVEFDTDFFPSDDTGEHGFDNIGDVLSISPLLLEKYVDAASKIVSVVPTSSAVVREQTIPSSEYQVEFAEEEPQDQTGGDERSRGERSRRSSSEGGRLVLSYYEPVTARATTNLELAGDYTIRLRFIAVDSYVDNVFDYNKCELTFSLDGETLLQEEFVRQGGKDYSFSFQRALAEGPHEVVLSVKPLSNETQVRDLRFFVQSVKLIGPSDPQHFVKPDNYEKYFPRPVPTDGVERREYARWILSEFASRAFRRPADPQAVDRLVDLAESVYSLGRESFESGIVKAMTAVLASPSFLFREEFALESTDGATHKLLDEYTLASRLSYFFWSTMPDQKLIELAEKNQLRANLDAQIDRMLADNRSQAFFENFTGQWLKARVIDTVPIVARSVLRREAPPDPEGDARRKRFFELFRKGEERTDEENAEFEKLGQAFRPGGGGRRQIDLTPPIRTAMRRETEMTFEHVVREDRPLTELLDSDYTFLNQPLAEFYGISGVEGNSMRKVALPADDHRGGVLTQGTFLVVTSNPDRTSPVKRGLFILEKLLGTPPAAPPPDIPPLEDSEGEREKPRSLRETLAVHREKAICSSCHNRMDPLGLALENFNALGRFRTSELGQTIDASGTLLSGETFNDVRQLKRILANEKKTEFYRCLTEKLLTYALGRSIEYTDLVTLDRVVEEIEANDGRSMSLIRGVVHSAPFQSMLTGRGP